MLRKLDNAGAPTQDIVDFIKGLDDPSAKEFARGLRACVRDFRTSLERLNGVRRSLGEFVESMDWVDADHSQGMHDFAVLVYEGLSDAERDLENIAMAQIPFHVLAHNPMRCRSLSDIARLLHEDYGLTFPEIAALTQGESPGDAWYNAHQRISGKDLRDGRSKVIKTLRQSAHRGKPRDD